jgi:hypothetical protein
VEEEIVISDIRALLRWILGVLAFIAGMLLVNSLHAQPCTVSPTTYVR